MTILPDGRLLVCEQSGTVWLVKNDVIDFGNPFLNLAVNLYSERGLVGIVADPNFVTNGYIYVYYTTPDSPVHNRLSRFIVSGDRAIASSETVLLDLPELNSNGYHNGGALHFGPDGKLYISVGENGVGTNSQSLSTPMGKILRINSDGTIPTDNPFYAQASGQGQAAYVIGLRNPFTFSFQPGTGKMYINDVGGTKWEEINEGTMGANCGWPIYEGASTAVGYKTPVYTYPHPVDSAGTDLGAAITGGCFYNPTTATFPATYQGKYFFVDCISRVLSVLDPATGGVTAFGTIGAAVPLYLTLADDGSIYYCAHDDGSLYKIQYSAALTPQIGTQPQSQLVSVGYPATFTIAAYGAGTLTYSWQRKNAGATTFTAISGATDTTYTLASAALADSGAQFRCVVTNSAGASNSNAATLTVTSNKPPAVTIGTPVSSTSPYINADQKYTAGSTIQFTGSATDPEDGALAATALTWKVTFQHNTHYHPFIPETSGITGGSFVIPNTGETDNDVWYRIYLMATDSTGLTTTSYRDIYPVKANVTLATSPAGLALSLDGKAITTPTTFIGVTGLLRTIAATPQAVNGVVYDLASWSDGGAASHTIATPAANTTYTATFAPVTTPVDKATFALQDVPTSMVAGQHYTAAITFKNTGTSIWTRGTYRLGSQNAADNTVWGVARANVPASVNPGDSVTFNIGLTAPATAGTYNFQWQMLKEGVGWFGDLTTNIAIPVQTQGNAAAYVSAGVPSNMIAGYTYAVSVTMKNVGTNTWTTSGLYRLGSQNVANPSQWGPARVGLPASVAPGGSATFNFTVTAPTTPGTYSFQWQMLQEGVQWFGDKSYSETITVAPLPNDAVFISQTAPPASMLPGQAANVSVTMQNTGTATWTAGTNFRLGSANAQDNVTWGFRRVALPASVAPGAQVTFNFTVNAPAAVGTYNFQWQMMQEGVQWFGTFSTNVAVTVAVPAYSSTFVSQTAPPAAMVAGQYATVAVTFKNTGSNTWTSGSSYRLGSLNPMDNINWGLRRVSLPASVAPGGTATFTFGIAAPATPGTYNFQWQMMQEGVQWFGDASPNVSVVVSAPPANAATFVMQTTPPAAMTTGQTSTVSVTMKNIGTATWTAGANFRLGSQNPQDNNNWGRLRINLPASVAPGAQVTFSFPVTAPSVAGTYNFQWQMLQEGVQWFGDYSTNFAITVSPPAAASRVEVLNIAGTTLQGNPLKDAVARRVALFVPQQVVAGQTVPIVYFLPGFNGSSESYIAEGTSSPFATLVQSLADAGKPLVLAVPDCRNRFGGSQYLNSTAQGNYADYVTTDVIAAVEARYPAAAGRLGRIVAGHSSGGFGALRFGMAKQALFGAVVALSPDSEFAISHLPFVQDPAISSVTPATATACSGPTPTATAPNSSVALAFGLSAAYAPVGSSQPGFFNWLYDSTGTFQTAVWQKWLDNDPLNLVQNNVNAFASDQRIYLDGAANDEWKANIGAHDIYNVLTARAQPSAFNQPPGGHTDNISGRLGVGLRWVFGIAS